ncbi:F0F1 ATP synthase subunit gamma [Pseudomarimonas salicorniae]|uniref:ATP synthase gamma chain n=1 Tax=Pseudomarimonas salicorniae TaxID=2933270 RepID=A0ABT0GC28_9GAMM|nr:F0F1 ATP synthase subunit gamma [Lysobacter sp. CAU 1642]MCK7592103.1 F0F1 ATP synthase subunit gamma [Lysobacter sp. CAU 1642]
MAGGREIKTKIKSVQNTRKVTRALEMVSASKIRKAQDRMKASRPYARLMRQMIGHIAKANSEYVHPFLQTRDEVKRVGYVIVSTDRGLCGGLNSSMFRRILAEMREWQQKGVEVDVVCIGQKGTAFFRRLKVNMLASVSHLGEQVHVDQLVGVIKVMLDAYSQGNCDRVFLCYNDFINTMAQKPRQDQLLPLPPSDDIESKHDWDYIYEPDAQTVLDNVLTRYVESLVYQAVLENQASEHAARMVAMKAASDNATKLIGTLNLVYNKARQAAITQEISEIVGGAAAV